MNKILRPFLIVMTLALIPASIAAEDQAIDISQRAALQAAMQRHINRNLVAGVYLQMNSTSGEIRSLFPVKAHPLILRLGEYFVLCSDFRDKDGKPVNIDFYLARRDNSYVIFHTAIDDRDLLRRLMKAGKIKHVDS